MKKIYIDEVYCETKTILTFVIFNDKTKSYLYKWIRKIIKKKEKSGKTKSILLSELKSYKLKRTKYWTKILGFLNENIPIQGKIILESTPQEKRTFQEKYSKAILYLIEKYKLPIIVDIINNKKFMIPIEKVVNSDLFSVVNSHNESGVQIADLVCSNKTQKPDKIF